MHIDTRERILLLKKNDDSACISVSQNEDEINANFGDFSSPYSNFTFEQQNLLDVFYEKRAKCGQDFYNLIGPPDEHGVIQLACLPVFCNNRACDNAGCKDHRKYLYKRNHEPQINHLKKDIRKPKAYVFSGWNIPLFEWDVGFIREFCRMKMIKLYRICRSISRSEFSIHMEIKLYPEGHEKEGIGWLHFHVVSGYIDVHKAREMWKRVVKYEQAIKYECLEGYISKYASKTPVMDTFVKRDVYHLIVYKTQMHRYSIRLSECERVKRKQLWYIEDLLLKEVFNRIRSEAEDPCYYNCWYEEHKKEFMNCDKPPTKKIDEWNDI